MSSQEWHAYKRGEFEGVAHYTYAGTFPSKEQALQVAGRGGFIEPWPLNREDGMEEGFPKSFQIFNGPPIEGRSPPWKSVTRRAR